VRLVVAGLLSIDPPLVLPSLFHGVQRTPGGGSFREPLETELARLAQQKGNAKDASAPKPKPAHKQPVEPMHRDAKKRLLRQGASHP
jgi:hypothetical protein